MKIVFFGTPPFAAEILKTLLKNGIEVVGIVTKPDKPQGRSHKLIPPALKEAALLEASTIPLFQPELVSSLEFAPTLAALQADLFVVVAYGEIIKQHLLDMPRYGCINVHASILPKYRGAAPIQRSIVEGESETGITIMQMVRKMDAGDIIKIATVPIGENTTYGELEQQLCRASMTPLLEVLAEYQKGSIPLHTAQDTSLVTFAPKLELEDCEIDWGKSCQEIHNLIRGVNPEPGAWCYVTVKEEKKRLKIFRTTMVPEATAEAGNLVDSSKNEMIIACDKGALKILELQLEGKRRMNIAEFICGGGKRSIKFELPFK